MSTRIEERYRLLTEAVPVQIWTASPDGRLDYVSDQAAKALGRPAEQMVTDGWQSVVHAEDLPLADERWMKCLVSGEDYEVEFRLKLADGEYAWHLARAVARRGTSGSIIQWCGTNTNIHEQREASRLVLQASLAKDEFLATVSHELRTPLSAILGWARLLRSGQLDPSAYARGLSAIERNAQAQVKLVDDILDGSRIISGKLHLEIRPLDLTMLVQAALDAIRPAMDAKQQVITVALDPDAARVTGDPERLQQVVWNLVNNAVKFTPKGGAIGVQLFRSGTSIELLVSDSGQGINSSFLPYVFDRFRQAEGSTTRRHGGLGLGLALVRHLVEAHGGTVSAESDGQGRGSRFRVLLPVQAVYARDSVPPLSPASDAAAVTPEELSSLKGVSVLVVDDEQDARELVATVLTTSGASVTTASSVAQALAQFARSVPMVIVSDVGMPEADGYELMRRLRASGVAGSEVPAIALTAYAREQDRRLALEAGFQTHVAKPVEPAELVRVVRSIVRFVGNQSSSGEREAALGKADVLLKFEKILATQGVLEALRFLNSRTAHRYTAIYRFDPPTLRNVLLVDSHSGETKRGEDAPIIDTYCTFVFDTQRGFATGDANRDERLTGHPAVARAASYYGVLLRDAQGTPWGSLCHFDALPCEIPAHEIPLLDAAARLFVPAIMASAHRSAGP